MPTLSPTPLAYLSCPPYHLDNTSSNTAAAQSSQIPPHPAALCTTPFEVKSHPTPCNSAWRHVQHRNRSPLPERVTAVHKLVRSPLKPPLHLHLAPYQPPLCLSGPSLRRLRKVSSRLRLLACRESPERRQRKTCTPHALPHQPCPRSRPHTFGGCAIKQSAP